MYTSIIATFLFIQTQALAAPFCPPTRDLVAGPSEITKYFFKAATIGAADRRTLKEFAKESHETEAAIQKRYAASGDFRCGDGFGQAQVVGKGDLILAPAHMLYDGDDCEKARDLKGCALYLMENGKRVAYEVAKEESEGYVCPDKRTVKTWNDWAILRLKKKVNPNIKPYTIGHSPCASESLPTDVVFVAKSRDYGAVANKPMAEAPRHYGRCQLMRGYCGLDSVVTESDCDLAPGASGGGLFIGDKNPELVAINSGHRNSCPESAADKTGPYKTKCWAAASVPIEGEFRNRLEQAINN